MRTALKIFLTLFLSIVSGLLIYLALQTPTNNRDWSVDNAVLPYAEFNEDDTVTIRNVRNFDYESVLEYTPNYYDKTYDLSQIDSVDFVNEPFSNVAAHTFLTFGFKNGDQVAVSVEIRREKGEFYDVLKGMLRQYELTYVIADERDVLRLRTNYRKGDVYMYPIKISERKARALFVDMLNRVNKLAAEPEFYNTITNNCTTNIVDHVNNVAEPEAVITPSFNSLFPAFSDKLAFEMKFIDAEGTFEEIKERFLITEIAQKYNDDPDFSAKIRQELELTPALE